MLIFRRENGKEKRVIKGSAKAVVKQFLEKMRQNRKESKDKEGASAIYEKFPVKGSFYSEGNMYQTFKPNHFPDIKILKL